MSTGAECRFTEVEPGRWTYWLQSWPYGDSPDGETYGPFRSFKAATEHLDVNHANPGGYSWELHPTGHVHEFGEGMETVEAGVYAEVRVASDDPYPSAEQLLEAIRLQVERGQVRTWPRYEQRPAVVCNPCGVRQGSADEFIASVR